MQAFESYRPLPSERSRKDVRHNLDDEFLTRRWASIDLPGVMTLQILDDHWIGTTGLASYLSSS